MSVTNEKGNTKSKRAKVIKRFSISIATPRRDSISVEKVYETEEKIEGSGLKKTDLLCSWQSKVSPLTNLNILIESLEILLIQTKAGHDGCV